MIVSRATRQGGVIGVVTRRGVLAAAAGLAAGVPAVARGGRQPAVIVPPLSGVHRTLPSGRTYWLSGAGRRLVVGVHGSNLTAQNVNAGMWVTGNPATAGWQAHAAAAGYVLALAEGLGGGVSWNVGAGWPSGPQDDLAYLAQVAADAAAVTGAAAAYVAGFSAGGALAWRAVADRPDVFPAAGVCSGWAPAIPGHPVRVHHIHGDADATVPIRGGHVPVFPYTFPAAWLEAARAAPGSRVVLEPLPGLGHAAAGWAAGQLWEVLGG
jgi:poly(3-hydroxybutyrate) depolymerase